MPNLSNPTRKCGACRDAPRVSKGHKTPLHRIIRDAMKYRKYRKVLIIIPLYPPPKIRTKFQ